MFSQIVLFSFPWNEMTKSIRYIRYIRKVDAKNLSEFFQRVQNIYCSDFSNLPIYSEGKITKSCPSKVPFYWGKQSLANFWMERDRDKRTTASFFETLKTDKSVHQFSKKFCLVPKTRKFRSKSIINDFWPIMTPSWVTDSHFMPQKNE